MSIDKHRLGSKEADFEPFIFFENGTCTKKLDFVFFAFSPIAVPIVARYGHH